MLDSVKTLAGLYEVNTGLVIRAVDGLSADEISRRPEGTGNPMLWIAGHLTSSRYGICKYLGLDLEWPFGDLFSRGSALKTVEVYPGIEELMNRWRSISAHLQEAFHQTSELHLAKPVERSFPGVSQTVSGAISFLHLHESYHVGQLAYIRKLLGHSQLVG